MLKEKMKLLILKGENGYKKSKHKSVFREDA